jgi:hypothetical protein
MQLADMRMSPGPPVCFIYSEVLALLPSIERGFGFAAALPASSFPIEATFHRDSVAQWAIDFSSTAKVEANDRTVVTWSLRILDERST